MEPSVDMPTEGRDASIPSSSAVTVAATSISSSSSAGQNLALIAGVTGIVGASLVEQLVREDAPGGPWKVYGIARRRPQGQWLRDCESLEYVQCDLLSKEDTESKLAPIRKYITHVFYVTWASRPTEEENCEANGRMLRHVLDAVVDHAPGLRHVCLQTGIKHYLGSHFEFDGERTRVGEVYEEAAPRCEGLNFYYVQEDILAEKLQGRPGVTWSVHRPGLIMGLSPHSLVNAALALAVYAAICSREGRQLAFTGTRATWGCHLEASDADLVAAQEVWAATEPAAASQAYNAANDSTTTWAELWPAIASSFGTEPAPFGGQPQSFVALMRDKAPVWDAIVREHGLVPTKIDDFLGGWQVLDITLQKLPAGKSSMEKSRRFGFHETRDTKQSFLYWFDKMRERKLIP